MSLSRNKIHDYLGMTLDDTVCGQLRINMISYIEDIIAAFERVETKGDGTKSIAALNNFFVVNKDCKKFNQNKVVKFHNLVANNLYATKLARKDT